MEKKLPKRNIIILIILIISLLAVFSALTYAFFSAGEVTNNATESNVVTLTSNYGSIVVNYSDGRIINSRNVVLIEDQGDSVDILKFSVHNTGTATQNIVIGWSDLINDFCHYVNDNKECTNNETDTPVMDELSYTLYECDNLASYNNAGIENMDGCLNNISNLDTQVPLTGATDLMHIEEKITIENETIKYYIIKLRIENKDEEQNYNQKRNMSARILVNYFGKSIEGDLEDIDGNSLAFAKMTFNSEPITTYTDENGYFKFTNVPIGDHTIQVMDENEVISSGNVSIIEAEESSIESNELRIAGNSISLKLLLDGSNLSFSNIYEFEELYTSSSDNYTYELPIIVSGTYKIELWGKNGKGFKYGNEIDTYGGYTSGKVRLQKDDVLYFTVNSGSGATTGGYGYPGGGATDVRFSENNLNARIMVAGGGGSATYSSSTSYSGGVGGNAGGLIGYKGKNPNNNNSSLDIYAGKGATQFNSGENGYFNNGSSAYGTSGVFGLGGTNTIFPSGAGGFYGGGSGGYYHQSSYSGGGGGGSGGGSSYISGHAGCVAIAEAATGNVRTTRLDSNNIFCSSDISHGYKIEGYNTDAKCSEHYSGKVFTNTLMIDGAGYKWEIIDGVLVKTLEAMPNPLGGFYASGVGHTGDGYARISFES